ncbi:MAG: ASKHA domain-containing protein [Bacillota bacterium]
MIGLKLEGNLVRCKATTKLSKVILQHNIPLYMPCGEGKKCGKCVVKIVKNAPEPTPTERDFLQKQELADGLRLACCVFVVDGMEVVDIAKEQKMSRIVSSETKIAMVEPLFQENEIGIAIDLGTTTLAVRGFTSSIKEATKSVVRRNPQSVFGSDVISRIESALLGNAEKLQEVVIHALQEMIDEIVETKEFAEKKVGAIVITGNTTMLYLLTRKNPKSLAKAPFFAEHLFGEYVEKPILSLRDSKKIYLMRCISAFVGGDIATAILASGMMKQGEKNLLIDIGTNGEIVFWNDEKLYCCSTAAGPALEGAELTSGMTATTGAIAKVTFSENEFHYETVDGSKPKGLCGSGIIDALSLMKDLCFIDEMGAIDKEELQKNGAFVQLENDIACRVTENVAISQRDIRKIQLAKSAICAGILTLIEESGVSLKEVTTLYIAGGFGTYMNLENAANIGLIPKELVAKTKVIGNAALDGASLLLGNKNEFRALEYLEQLAETIDLSKNKIFMEHYIDGMEFE